MSRSKAVGAIRRPADRDAATAENADSSSCAGGSVDSGRIVERALRGEMWLEIARTASIQVAAMYTCRRGGNASQNAKRPHEAHHTGTGLQPTII